MIPELIASDAQACLAQLERYLEASPIASAERTMWHRRINRLRRYVRSADRQADGYSPPFYAEWQEPLSPREAEVARLVAQGYMNKDVANMLHVSERTIRTHLSSIYSKLGITNRTQLCIFIRANEELVP